MRSPIQPVATAARVSTQPAFALLGFACFLGLVALWLLASELLSLSGRDDVNSVSRAANVGMMRGDLWARQALAFSKAVPPQNTGQAASDEVQTNQVHARALAERAVRWSPHDARLWTLLADLQSRAGGDDRNPAAFAKMAFYTGFNTTELIPTRLAAAVRSQDLSDDELQDMIRQEIRLIATRLSQQRPALKAAYAQASNQGRALIRKTLSDIDPTLLSILDGAS